ncbi:STAS domain-containing protein [Shewanella sp. CG12_big_fil_rev_8_21_14_0_65_47_15]|uniref:STAS domain-containing protein n=1 Tax=Shewanella sp. CG12_big_fil_rev_8_21_14_0_65_47_15 TaxID=1975537 RepID=UPI000CAF3D52|nr:STAS domain-containing protein [Shewanella sp. CG12_big_fil_rev_8_21_14_0_65_47_15]PIW58734.1 MAG: phospholipid ABC transporter [Shewanella sp. CG12_big_fil_rev_8_21_14_0_65_47_15]
MVEFVQQGRVCHIKGRLSQTQVIALWPQRQNLLEKQTQELSLSGLEYSDSAGVAFLLALVRAHNSPLTLCLASEQLKKLIDLYDLQSFFTEEAL